MDDREQQRIGIALQERLLGVGHGLVLAERSGSPVAVDQPHYSARRVTLPDSGACLALWCCLRPRPFWSVSHQLGVAPARIGRWVLAFCVAIADGIEQLPVTQLIDFGLELQTAEQPERDQKYPPDQIPEKHPDPND